MGKLPFSWNPNREQSSWDRTFSDMLDIAQNITSGSDKWNQWFNEAVSFRDIIDFSIYPNERFTMESALRDYNRENGT
jgi:hypothetical protein